MSRPAAVVRPATGGDVDALEALWDEIGELLGDGASAGAVQRFRRRVRRGDADQTVVVAWVAGTPVGLLTYAVVDPGPWGEVTSLVIGLLHVRDGSRHRGVARSLLGWVVARADELGCADVAVQIPPSLREANRFFARFGFAPVVTRRATSTAALASTAHDGSSDGPAGRPAAPAFAAPASRDRAAGCRGRHGGRRLTRPRSNGCRGEAAQRGRQRPAHTVSR